MQDPELVIPYMPHVLAMLDCTCNPAHAVKHCTCNPAHAHAGESIARAGLHVQRRLHVQLEFACTCKTPRQEKKQIQILNGRESR